jgi:hypothetical protein
MFIFNQSVMTPNGRATFIAYLVGRNECQVSRWVHRDNKKYCVNEIYIVAQISNPKEARQTHPQPVPVSQVVDVAL